jgi:aryl-alcohol dehydrogenase-like predicted oxidoreductase
MDTRRIGSLSVSVVGLGCNNFGWKVDAQGAGGVVNAALDAGVTFFDTADTYGGTNSEVFLGRGLGKRRDEVTVATKFGWQIDEHRKGAHPAYVRRAVEDSLRRLATDRIDLYQLHKPDPTVPIEDTLGVLGELVRAGKVREIGASNMSGAQVRAADAASLGRARFVSVQNEYNLVQREAEREVLPECERLKLAFVPYFPLASGLLTGKYRKGQPPPAGSRLDGAGRFADMLSDKSLSLIESLIAFAESHGHTLLELAFAWLLSHRVIASVIAGATSPEQVRTNARATEWRLTTADLAELDLLLGAAK